MIIAEIPDLPDFPALDQLASALWSDGRTRGAAVLVGAGFSRNAELAGHDVRHPPLWPDLRRAMVSVLYQSRPGEAPSDPLRLAEEFRTYLGQAALVEFIREQIPDASWSPGRQHSDLMALPWADVLTTNYDTLLERASKRHHVVRETADLALVKGPRVLKLHGSVDGNAPLVITEEDYRTYPRRSAAFVNTARQVFLENELCLIGFSGDDPNFLQWSGWVRDHLGESARRIYLVGSLKLGPAKRRLLESRNVAPIDFAPLTTNLPPDEAEARASELFLRFLASRKPKRPIDWEPADNSAYGFVPADHRHIKTRLDDPATATSLLQNLTHVWSADRESCPDWLVMPSEKRAAVGYGTARAPWGYLEALRHLEVESRKSLLEVAAWRCSVSLQPLGDKAEAAISALVKVGREFDRGRRTEFARTLLRGARLNRNKLQFREIEELLETLALPGSDARAELVAQRLLWARDGLDLATVSKDAAVLVGPDPVWRLLRAALHCECGETDLAKPLVDAVRLELDERLRSAPHSVWVASRCAWADVFARAIKVAQTWRWERDPLNDRIADGYDAEDEIDSLRKEIRYARLQRSEEPEGFQPRFEPGAYEDHKSTIRFEPREQGGEAETTFRFADAACLPLKIGNVDLLGGIARDALDGEPQDTLHWHLRLLRTISSHSAPALERHFGRVAVARLEATTAAELTRRVFCAIRFWQPRVRQGSHTGHAMATEKLSVFLEVLSRLVICVGSWAALEAFALAVELASEIPRVHPTLYERIENVLKSSIASLPPRERSALALECLEFPLAVAGPPTPFRWPNPITELFSCACPPKRTAGDSRWRSCVSKLLVNAGGSGAARAQAVHRLAYLDVHSSLDHQERTEFGRQLWSSTNPERGGLPTDIDLLPHIVATLPGTESHDSVEIARAYLHSAPLILADLERRLYAISTAAIGDDLFSALLPTRSEAVTMMDGISGLIDNLPDDGSPFNAQAKKRLISAAGGVLGSALLPVMEAADLDGPKLAFVDRCARPGSGGGAIAGLHELVRLYPEMAGKICADMRRAIARDDIGDVQGAALSVDRWAALEPSGRYDPVPELLKNALIAALEVGFRPGLHPRLWCARRLLEAGQLSVPQIDTLVNVLGDLISDLAYHALPQGGPAIIGVTLARAECVHLASHLEGLGHQCQSWITAGMNDPLPEVKFVTS